MNIVTLTSDLGTKDYYVASVKAAALKLVPDLEWIDISHHVPPFDMAKAAFVLKNVWREFPAETIHIIGVDCDWRADTPYVIVEKDDQLFIGSDNGIFSLIFDGEEAESVHIISLDGDEDLSFPTKSIFIGIAAQLANGKRPSDLGTPAESYKRRPSINPVIEHDNIRGTVIYIDAYGNVITNITRSLFEEVVGDKRFQIVLRRGDDDLSKISRAYNEVAAGEKLALFTSGGYLEIAINRGVEGSGGGAAGLLGIRENDIIRVESMS
jgi:S-adenosylmethionine hydrolase